MAVPRADPTSCIFVDGILEQVVEKPDMARVVGIQVTMCLKLDKEVLPLLPKAAGDIVPQSLDARIVNTSVDGSVDEIEKYYYNAPSPYI